jgi:hypothetical protein
MERGLRNACSRIRSAIGTAYWGVRDEAKCRIGALPM